MNTLALITAVFISLIIFLVPQEALDKTSLNYTIKGCAETEEGMALKSATNNNITTPIIYAIDGIIYYERALNHQCCKKVTLNKTVNETIININEEWTGIGCKCMCYSEINATITGIKEGNYTIQINEGNTTIKTQNITI